MKTLRDSKSASCIVHGTNTFSPEEQLILALARKAIHSHNPLELKDLLLNECFSWQKFKRFLLYHQLSPLAYYYLKDHTSSFSEEIELLKKEYYSCEFYLSYLWQEFTKIAKIFNAEKIEFLPLKGIAFLVENIYIDKRYLRPMSDIDLFIKKEALSSVENILKGLGYVKELEGMKEDYWKNKSYHLGFMKKSSEALSCCVEIHWDLDYKRNIFPLPYLWNRARRLRIQGQDINMLSPEDTLFSLALHQRRFGRNICLKDIRDTALVLKKYSAKLDWDYILKEAKRSKIRASLYFILLQAKLLLKVNMPYFLLKALNIPSYKRRLMEQFIFHNTFPYSLGLNNSDIAKRLYLVSHFLVYDNFWEPIRYIKDIPQEQFAKFYGLSSYTKKTEFLYRARYLYFLKTICKNIFQRNWSICKNELRYRNI